MMDAFETRLKQYYRKIQKSDTQTKAIYLIMAALFVLTFFVRASLIRFQSGDYAAFSSWYNFVKANGIHSFHYTVSNYNPPYTYFLYIATLLPVTKIFAIKSILVLFDFIMAYSVYLVVKLFRPEKYVALIAALGSLFLPTVLLNGVFWGQFDDFYTAFIFFSLYCGLKNKSRSAWLLFGLAIAIKLQAIFFAPVLAILIFKRIKWHDIYWAIISFCVVTFPPVLFGRSVSSIIDIYRAQTHLFNGSLTLNAPSIWNWVPGSDFRFFNNTGVFLTGAAALFLILLAIMYKKYSQKSILIVTSLMLYLVPFLLPQMHDRYFFPAGIGSFVLAVAYPGYAWIAVLMQAVTVFVYSPFAFGTEPVPMLYLSFIVLFIIYALARFYLSDKTKEAAAH